MKNIIMYLMLGLFNCLILLPVQAAFLAVVEVDDPSEFSRLKNKEGFVFLAVGKFNHLGDDKWIVLGDGRPSSLSKMGGADKDSTLKLKLGESLGNKVIMPMPKNAQIIIVQVEGDSSFSIDKNIVTINISKKSPFWNHFKLTVGTIIVE
jgi:hypothetical protein